MTPRSNSRRQFLAATLVAPAVLPGPATQGQELASHELIDCQSHLFCPALVQRMEASATEPKIFLRDGVRTLKMGDWYRKVPDSYMSVEGKLAAMDAAGITRTAISINDPGPEWFGASGPEVARIANDYIAQLAADYPSRFFGLCVLPFPDMSATIQELNRCVEHLGMRGVLLYTNLAGEFADEAKFAPFWQRVEALKVPVLLHPAKPIAIEHVKAYEMTSTLGNMFDNTIALTRIILSGLLDRHPDLKLVCPHLGGTLPFILGRLDHQLTVLKRGPRLPRTPLEYLRQIWLDIVSPLPEALAMCHSLLGADRLLYASDHPWVDPQVMLSTLEKAGLPLESQRKIRSGNAISLFGL
jgi:predicted TIM-barrel fold metal-dependent hydrolase